MLKNYLKIAWRNLKKRRFYSFVTIFGLSIGLTFSLLIGSYVWGELHTNDSLTNVPNQFMIQSKWKKENMGIEITSLGAVAKALKDNYPNMVANYYRFDGVTTVVSKGEKVFSESVQLGDSTFLSMYGFPLLHGDNRTALIEPNSMVISTDQAIKYFGKTDVVGNSLTVESFSGGKAEFTITGVLDKVPLNSITNLTGKENVLPIIMSFINADFFGRNEYDSWFNPYIANYLELKEGVKPESVEKAISQLVATHSTPEISQNLIPKLVPIKKVHQEANGGLVRKTVWTLSLIAIFILLMSVVNYVNIFVGAASSRLKEIGVRKVMGSTKKQLLFQFLAESILISLFSFLFSLVLYQIFRPFFGGILQKDIVSIFSASPFFYMAGLGLTLMIGLLSGIYPAFVLSTIPSVDSMKGKLKSVKENVFFRRALIVFQFSVAIFVFGGALAISKQVNYFFTKDLGYTKSSVLSLKVPRDWSPEGVAKMETIRNEMAKLKEVKNASLSWVIPDGNFGQTNGIYRVGQDSTDAVFTPLLVTDEKFAETYKIKMLDGKFFNADGKTYQPGQIVLNEEAAKSLGYKNPQEALGKILRMHSTPSNYTISGVCKNFHFESMHKAMGPVAFMHVRDNNFFRYLNFQIQSGNPTESIQNIEAKWNTLLPSAPFEYKFVDETLQKLYQTEIQLKKAAQLATILAIFIVLLGILGVVSLNITRRTKELGIRKVLGATTLSIVNLFNKEFSILILIAVLITVPFYWFSMKKWLENYAYRIDLSWISFLMVGMVFAGLVLFLVSFQVVKAALVNPARSLKVE
jgi:putative ABC transport system permease protein